MESIKWTDKNILTGKTLPVIVLTMALNSFLFRLGDNLLYALIPGGAVYTVAMWVYAVASMAASLLLSVKLLKFVCSKKLEHMDADAAEAYLCRESKFKWHVLFTIGVCFLTLLAVILACSAVLLATTEDVPSTAATLGVTLAVILSVVLVIIGGKKLHWHMVQLTATNAELIDEVYSGLYDDKIPSGITQADIIAVLYCAAAYSVTAATVIHVAVTVLKKIGKLFLKILGISTLLALILAKIAGDGFERQMDEMVQGHKAAMDARERDDLLYAMRQGEADGKRKAAQFAYEKAQRANAYNANTYHAQRERNMAKKAILEWQDAERRR